MKKALSFLTPLLLMLSTSIVFADQPSIDVGPKVGQSSPQISVVDINNQQPTINQLSGQNGVIVVFFRSADWCPFCKKHLIELNQQADKFKKLGFGLAAISYDNTDILKSFSQEKAISYPLLSDQNVETMIAFNVLNTDYQPADDHYGIPYPGVVVIDKNGKVLDKHFFEGYKQRVKFADLHKALAQHF
ncbi:peroxiredoxin family protein [Thalassotalea sp. PLHSN55]|uniref:peroxiredoxin family protein n=1 Tax=Thalassotalea sp. PLHSN55 TaxID=3435888 RepID=UPI003F843342